MADEDAPFIMYEDVDIVEPEDAFLTEAMEYEDFYDTTLEELQSVELDRCRLESEISSVAEDEQSQSLFLGNLPEEIILKVLRHLSPGDLAAAALSCRRLRRLTKESSLWRNIMVEVEGFRSGEVYDPLLRITRGGFTRKRMSPGPKTLDEVLSSYRHPVSSLHLRHCVIGKQCDAVALAHALQRVSSVHLDWLDMSEAAAEMFCRRFIDLHQEGKIRVKELCFYEASLDNTSLADLSGLLRRVDSVHLGTCSWNPDGFRVSGFARAIRALAADSLQVRRLALDMGKTFSSSSGEGCAEHLAALLPRIVEVDFCQSVFSEQVLATMAEAVRLSSPEQMRLKSVLIDEVRYSPQEFVRRFKARRPHFHIQ